MSVALEKNVLAVARKAAAAEGLSLSRLLTNLLNAHLEQQARFASMDRFIEEHARHVRVTDEHIQAIRDQMGAPPPPLRRGRRRRAA